MNRFVALLFLMIVVGCEDVSDDERELQAAIDSLAIELEGTAAEIEQGFAETDSMRRHLEAEQLEIDSLRDRIEANQQEIDAMMGR